MNESEIREEAPHNGRLYGVIAGGLAVAAAGIAYIAEHKAPGSELVLAMVFGDRTIGVDSSEVLAGIVSLCGLGAAALSADVIVETHVNRRNQASN